MISLLPRGCPAWSPATCACHWPRRTAGARQNQEDCPENVINISKRHLSTMLSLRMRIEENYHKTICKTDKLICLAPSGALGVVMYLGSSVICCQEHSSSVSQVSFSDFWGEMRWSRRYLVLLWHKRITFTTHPHAAIVSSPLDLGLWVEIASRARRGEPGGSCCSAWAPWDCTDPRSQPAATSACCCSGQASWGCEGVRWRRGS